MLVCLSCYVVCCCICCCFCRSGIFVVSFFFFKQKTAYEMRISDWSSDVCSSDLRVYKELMKRMLAENPAALVTFLKTENPMVRHYANMWRDGLRLDLDQVYERQGIERENMAAVLRTFKAQIKELLPFPEGKNETLADYEGW